MKKAWYMVGILFFAALVVSAVFSKNRISENRTNQRNFGKVAGGSAVTMDDSLEKNEKEIKVSSGDSVKTTKDTKYCIEVCQKNTGEIESGTYALPSELVGKTKEEISELLQEFQRVPGEAELDAGFINAQLLSFSEKKIVIRKNYLQKTEEFLLLPSEGKIVVYQNDGRTIYSVTDIPMDVLSEEKKEEIEHGKKVNSLSELYDYLESLSS